MSLTAIKQLVHELEYVLDCINKNKIPFDGDDFHEALRLGRQAIEQETDWKNAAIRVGEDLCSVGPFGYYDMTAEQWLDWALSVVTVHAPPPKREPLTDEQIAVACGWMPERGCKPLPNELQIARAIEAAHGIGEKK